MPKIVTTTSGQTNLDVPVSSRAAIVDYTAARAVYLDSLAPAGVLEAGTPNVVVVAPTLAAFVIPTAGATNWTLGSYVQLAAASALAAHTLTGLYFYATQAGEQFQVAIATGAPGSESIIGSFPFHSGTAGDGVWLAIVPGLRIDANARVAVAVAEATGINGFSVFVKAVFTPRPY